MPTLIRVETVREARGSLAVFERGVPFTIKRVFYTYDVPVGTVRGGHSHKRTQLGLVAVAGACTVTGAGPKGDQWRYRLADPGECLLLQPTDWHQMEFEVPGTVLLCLASEEYDPDDYVRDHPGALGPART